MEMSASMKWWATKKLLLKSDFYLFAGSYYLEKGGISKRMQSGADLNVGAEYKFNKQFSTFINLNNIFGGTYERWHNYPVYGFNFIGGIVFHF